MGPIGARRCSEMFHYLLGVGAMNRLWLAPAGLLVEYGDSRVMLDGGPRAEPSGPLNAWLVTDARAELIRQIREHASMLGVVPAGREVQGRRLPGDRTSPG